MHVDRVWDAVTRRSKPVVRGSDDREDRPLTFASGLLVIGLLVLVGLAILGGFFALFYSVVATLPASLITACPELQGCPAPESDNGPAAGVDDDHLISEPKMTP